MVFDKVKELIVDQLDVEEDAVKTESVIIDDLGADSLDVVDLVMSIEEEFDIEIPDEAVEGIKTVGDIVSYIESNQLFKYKGGRKSVRLFYNIVRSQIRLRI